MWKVILAVALVACAKVWSDEDTTRCRGSNETYSCVSDCQVQRCDQVGYGQICQDPASDLCTYKCTCEDDYVKGPNGRCIPKQDCPSCGGDPNATSGCGVYCGDMCSNYKNKSTTVCIQICYFNACDCKPDYVLDDVTKVCVKPEDCSV